MRIGTAVITSVTLCFAAHSLTAQDTLSPIRLGVRGASTMQPGLIVLAGPGLDSVHAVVRRDLDNSNRFTMSPAPDSLTILRGPFDPRLLQSGASGLTWAVELEPAVGGVDVKLYDLATGTIRQQATRPLDPRGVGDTRLTIHAVSDLIVGWTGGIGIASTRIAFKSKDGSVDAIWRVDSDGANLVRVSHGVGIYEMPAWSPDGSMVAFSVYRDGRRVLYLQRMASGTQTAVPASSPGDSYGVNFSPDGKTVVYTHGLEHGSAIESADISHSPCCAHLLTHDGKLADNVSPTYSPDGRRIAYVSTRTGTTEIWVMDNDGTNSAPLVASGFDTEGRPLATYSPAWSPDGTKIIFDRDTPSGGRQLYLMSVASRQVIQETSSGRNDDPSWAPDSRHVVFKSNRSGREQLWILDIESAVSRQIAAPGDVRYPAWSHVLMAGTNP